MVTRAVLIRALPFAVAVALYLPATRYGFVQDDKVVIAENPSAHSLHAALRAVGQPYWPLGPGRGELYRPVTIISYALDWAVGGGSPGWFHFMNALWHGLVVALVVVVLARWLPPGAALVAGLVFAVHPVHVEGVASLVARAELLAAAGMLGAVVAARRRWWVVAVVCAAGAMLSKEHGVVTGVVILLDDWLQGRDDPGSPRHYPAPFYVALAAITLTYVAVWHHVGGQATGDVAAPFMAAGLGGRLGVAFPAVLRAARLLVWPLDLSADYNPQVIPAPAGISVAALGGVLVVCALPVLAWGARRRAPALCFAAATAILCYLPTSNLLFPSGVVLAERTLYTPVLLAAAFASVAAAWAATRVSARRVGAVVAGLVVLLGARTLARLPVWRDNKTLLLATLSEHPESYRAHQWAASVLAGLGDTAGARRQYAIADSLFPEDARLAADRAFYLAGIGDTMVVADLVALARRRLPWDRVALRAQFLLWRARGAPAQAQAVADTAMRAVPEDSAWYRGEKR
jgi:hypothetical protein